MSSTSWASVIVAIVLLGIGAYLLQKIINVVLSGLIFLFAIVALYYILVASNVWHNPPVQVWDWNTMIAHIHAWSTDFINWIRGRHIKIPKIQPTDIGNVVTNKGTPQ